MLCPNCREVPKTLYCLNCGYPLYKEDLKKSEPEETEDVSVEVAPEPFSLEPVLETVEEEVSIEVEEPTVAPIFEEETEIGAKVEPAPEPVEEIVPVGIT